MGKESLQSLFAKHYFAQVVVLLLALSAILALLGQIVLNDIGQQSTNDANVLRIESQQRTLSQKVSHSAQVIEATVLRVDSKTQQSYKETLSNMLMQWQQVHNGLFVGSTSARSDTEAVRLVTSLEPHYHSLLNASYTLLASINAPLHTSHAMIAAPVQSILQEEPTYLHLMNTLIARYQRESENYATYIPYINFIAFGSTTIVIVESFILLFMEKNRLIVSMGPSKW